MKNRDKYLKIVEWSEEDKCYVGSVPGWIGNCCHGDNEEEVYHKVGEILDEWIEIYKKDGRPLPPATASKEYSGKFQLRLSKDLHKMLSIYAMQSGESLNNYCVKALKKAVKWR